MPPGSSEMRIICVDDEPLAVEYTVGQCRLLSQVSEVKGFTSAQEALDDLMIHPADVAILDINMPQIDGITLAARIKEAHPQTAILFLTAYKEYAFDAYSVHPTGYVHIKTFGAFDVYVDDRPISFKLARSKEILAYLVDKQGSGVTRAELFAAVWEDRLYDRKMQKQLDTYIRTLRETLQEYGIGQILEMEKGVLRVKPDTFVCDAYLFYSGDSDTINAYRGEYMSSYSWANMTEAILSWRTNTTI